MKKCPLAKLLALLLCLAFARPAVRAEDVVKTGLPSVGYKEFAPQNNPVPQPSVVDQWTDSVEYTVLLKQNGWRGWTYTSSAEFPEIEWVALYNTANSEYRQQCEKSYVVGWTAVKAAAASQTGELAVVMDLDETVLLNLKFQQENNGKFDAVKWNEWVARKQADAVPGAQEFINHVRDLGARVHLVWMSDRSSSLDDATVENMRSLGIYQAGDVTLSKQDKDDTKEVRRQCVTTGGGSDAVRCKSYENKPYPAMKIIAKFGDSLRDHFEIHDRAAAVQSLGDPKWGTEDFVLPNPMYGQWARDYK